MVVAVKEPYYVKCGDRIYDIGTGSPCEIPVEIELKSRIAGLRMIQNLLESELVKLDYSSKSDKESIKSIRDEHRTTKQQIKCYQDNLELYSMDLPRFDDLFDENIEMCVCSALETAGIRT